VILVSTADHRALLDFTQSSDSNNRSSVKCTFSAAIDMLATWRMLCICNWYILCQDVSDMLMLLPLWHYYLNHAQASHTVTTQSVTSFIFIARQHTDARCWYSNSVHPFVCLWCSRIRWKQLNILSVFSPYGSPIILVLSASNIFTKFRLGYPMRGR